VLACAQDKHRDQQVLPRQTQGLGDSNGVQYFVEAQAETHSQQEIKASGRKVLLEIPAHQDVHNL
jgi:hypothetical protein